VLEEARRGTLPGAVRTGVTFADAAAEWLRYIERDRRRKPSTVAGYRAIVRGQLLPVFGELPLESVTTAMIERWVGSLNRSASPAAPRRTATAAPHPRWAPRQADAKRPGIPRRPHPRRRSQQVSASDNKRRCPRCAAGTRRQTAAFRTLSASVTFASLRVAVLIQYMSGPWVSV
jgi:hypothetical protein